MQNALICISIKYIVSQVYEHKALKRTHITLVAAYLIVTFIPQLVLIILTGILKIDGPNVNKRRHIFKSILIVVMNFIQFDYLWEKLFTPEDELIRI